ncbi:hypothetical protein GOODEAATRI_027320 [Goodea atripinnis]|uniref:PMEL/NMB N-terminal domain-containing protein n=1 Tax=Goodea atripinnis TaxID=208336 RepID=A0ABV0ML48_9TELE
MSEGKGVSSHVTDHGILRGTRCGEVTFDLKNDAPTLTGAKATFTINLNFPPNQTVLPDGQVVWARNCTVNGRYWQVADGPSSSLTIGTDSVPLGSYTMELVIYHCRGRDRFIPLGYASSVFTITGVLQNNF